MDFGIFREGAILERISLILCSRMLDEPERVRDWNTSLLKKSQAEALHQWMELEQSGFPFKTCLAALKVQQSFLLAKSNLWKLMVAHPHALVAELMLVVVVFAVVGLGWAGQQDLAKWNKACLKKFVLETSKVGVKGRMLSAALAAIMWQGIVGTAQGLFWFDNLHSVHCAW